MRKTSDAKPVAKAEPAKKGMPKICKWILGIVAMLVVVALLGTSVVFSSAYFQKNTVALTVGENEISPAELNYYYRTLYNSMLSDYGDSSAYLSYMTEYILEEAKNSAVEAYAIYDAALAAGYALTEEEVQTLDAEEAELEATAKESKVTGDQLVQSVFGKGCDMASYRHYREMITLCGRYQQDNMDAQDTSAETLKKFYAENVDDLDTVTYHQFTLPVKDGSTMEETQVLAQSILDEAAADAAVMDAACLEHTSSSTSTLKSNITKNGADKTIADWLFDPARVEGDTQYFPNTDNTGLYLVRFGSYSDNDYNTVNVRHILISIGDDADETIKKEAQEKAQATLDEFRNGDKTEESFAALAQEYSDDNADEGGLYENIAKGQMVEAFEAWCFDPARKAGDSGIVETEYGYHVMYFVSEGENYRDILAESKLLSDFVNDWILGLKEGYTVTANDFGLKFVTTTSSYSA